MTSNPTPRPGEKTEDYIRRAALGSRRAGFLKTLEQIRAQDEINDPNR